MTDDNNDTTATEPPPAKRGRPRGSSTPAAAVKTRVRRSAADERLGIVSSLLDEALGTSDLNTKDSLLRVAVKILADQKEP